MTKQIINLKNIYVKSFYHHYPRSLLKVKKRITIVNQIIVLQKNPEVFVEEFQVWKITKIDEITFSTELQDGNLNTILLHYFQSASILIFELTVWLENSTLYFLSEH
ncbi:DUF6876 family protein [Kaistella sp.]|uniref:DUF6876 family protein n=1 Tax=Kaistella sp. TaxID=2782235 RepID=UPI003FA55947